MNDQSGHTRPALEGDDALRKNRSCAPKRRAPKRRGPIKRFLRLCAKLIAVVGFIFATVARAVWQCLPESIRGHTPGRRLIITTLMIAGGIILTMVGIISRPETSDAPEPVRRIDYHHIGEVSDLDIDTVSRWQTCLPDMPEPCIDMRIKRFTKSYGRMFNDSNYVHWNDALKIGIEPMSDTRSHWQVRRPLVKIASCEDFYIEDLRFSRPYLVPEAAAMLHEIGHRFRDTLDARGGGDYRIKVTSLLRTPSGISRLRRRNVNAVDSSVHQLGTTVDISYSRFVADSDLMPRSQADLKAVLAEVLEAMRAEGKCWVKHERNQPCFHITARPVGSPPPAY